MTDIAALIDDLLRRGIVLTLDGGDHVAAEPFSKLTTADLATLRAHRAEVLEYLQASPLPAKPFTWTPRAAETMLATVLDRCAYWRENASLQVRPTIEEVLSEYEPILTRLLDEGDYDSIRNALLNLQQSLDDIISGAD
jgi:hypothetical protein